MDSSETISAVDEGPAATAWPSAPEYDWTKEPSEVCGAGIPSGSLYSSNFFRSARWCHDGSAILTTAEDRTIRIFDTPVDGQSLGPPKCFAQPDAISATQWYPSASSSSPPTFCFMASVRDTSVRLVDATDGRVRATYPIVDHRERYVAPHCLAFNPTATKVYCGHENAIEVLDIATPGHDTSERLKTISTKKESEGQRGIISAIAFCPDYSGTYAAGTFNGSVSIYSEDTGSTPISHMEGVHPGGVTHLAFHPLSPSTLFVGSRRSSSIQVYDLRDVTAPISQYSRKGSTNQRLWFDVDPWGRYLASGDEEGYVKVWDISDLSKTEPIFERKLANDAIGSVQLHPFKPLLLAVSGSRQTFQERDDLDDSESDSDADSSGASEEESEEESDSEAIDVDPIISPLSRGVLSSQLGNVDNGDPPPVPRSTVSSTSKAQSLHIWSFA